MAWEVRPTSRFTTPNPTATERHRYAWNRQQQRAVPIAIDSPPPAAEVIATNQYVPYETTHFRHAYVWAGEQVARKFPEAVETLTTLDSLIEQQLNAMSSTDG